MKVSNKALYGIATVGVCILIVSEPAVARDITAAATSAVTSVKNIARALSVFGVVAGGALMQFPGASDFGKRTLVGGLMGCVCSFGGPAFISAIESIFGSV